MKRKSNLRHIVIYAILSLISVLSISPFFLMIITSFKNMGDLTSGGPLALPVIWRWDNYIRIWGVGNFTLYFRNSILVSGACVLCVVLFSLLGAYAFAYLDFKGKGFLFTLILLGLMIPTELIIIPLFFNLKAIKLNNTFWALIFPLAALILPFAIVLLRGFMRDIPSALRESAQLDGCTEIQSLIHIIAPMVKPAIISVVIFTSIWSWNNFMLPTILIQSDDFRTLPLGLNYFTGKYTSNYTMISTAANISAFPTILVFMILQRKFIEGMMIGALKE